MSKETLPDNDPDLQLARQVKIYLEDGISLSNIGDPLIQTLLSYKESVKNRTKQTSIDNDEVWNQIKSRTQPSKNSSTKFFSLETRKIWAAAAVLLIATIFGFLFLQFYDQPALLAQSNSTIETIKLSDGSTVTLRPYSSLYAIEDDKSAEIYSLKGEAYFEVTPNPERTFTIETQTGKASVLGTRFTLSTWGDLMQVYLEEGSVQVQALQHDSAFVLKPGESATVSSSITIPRVTSAQAREFTDWLDQQLFFEGKPTEQIISELEQHFNIIVTLPSDISNTTLSGQISLEDLQTSLEDLELVLGGEFIQTGDRTYVFEAN